MSRGASGAGWSRRRMLASLRGFGAGSLAAGSAACAWLAADRLPGGTGGRAFAGPPEPAAPLRAPRVLVIGDSMIAGGFGRFLEQGLARDAGCQTWRSGKTSSGLARPDFYDWPRVARELCSEHRPDAVVVMFGGNDVQGLRMPKSAPEPWIHWHMSGWDAEYRRRIRELADILAPDIDRHRLVWIGMPVMGRARLHAGVSRINRIYRGEMALRSNAVFIDIWSELANPADGSYTAHLQVDGGRLRVRARDGIHLTVKGARHLAGVVGPRIAAAITHSEGPRVGMLSAMT